jgi:micrococcal nuclease
MARGIRRGRISGGELRLTLLAGAFLGLIYAYSPSLPAADAEAEAEAPIVAEIAAVRVIDGDTFDYGGMRVRVADIDTPELRGRCAEEIDLARQASRRLEELLAAGPFELERLPSGRDEDRYGRKLRIVTRGGRSLGDELVAEGLARTWSGRREPWC